jgi:cobalt/nickel transport system permease protein
VTEEELGRKKPLSWKHAAVFFGILVVLTPLGLLAPGGAFGEDVPKNLDLAKYHLSAVPAGLDRFSSFWSHAVFGGYGFASGDHPVIGYLISAVVGCALVTLALVAFVLLYRRFGQKTDDPEDDRGSDAHHGVTV